MALSIASRHLGVTQRSALWSSDFPPVFAYTAKTSDCPAHLLLYLKIFVDCQVCKSVCFPVEFPWDVLDGYILEVL